MDRTEEYYIEFESARNEAMDSYFNARPGLYRTEIQEMIFEGGFRMAFAARRYANNEMLAQMKIQLDAAFDISDNSYDMQGVNWVHGKIDELINS